MDAVEIQAIGILNQLRGKNMSVRCQEVVKTAKRPRRQRFDEQSKILKCHFMVNEANLVTLGEQGRLHGTTITITNQSIEEKCRRDTPTLYLLAAVITSYLMAVAPH